jgi:hypothetical protein
VEPETPEAEQQAPDPNAGEENVIEEILSKSEFKFELEPMARRDNDDDADGPSAKF